MNVFNFRIKRMSSMLKLPIELIETIFSHVNSPQDILSLSQVCVFFNDIISRTDRIVGKLTLCIDYPFNLESFATSMKYSVRKYRNIKITRSREIMRSDYRDSSHHKIFENVSQNIRHLELNWSNSNLRRRENLLVDVVPRHGSRNIRDPFRMQLHYHQAREQPRRDSFQEFVDILKEFKNLHSMEWNHVHLERNTSPLDEDLSFLSSIKELVMKNCDAHCFEMLTSCNQLQKFDFTNPFWISTSRNPDIERFENFLIKQDNLKYLRLQNIKYSRLFQTDYSESINFKLHHLILKNIFFKDNLNAEKFFQTQDQLQSIDLQLQNERVRILDSIEFYNNILKTSKLNSLIKIVSLLCN